MFKFMIEGAKDNLDEKLKSPFWGSMIATWLTWNWEVWYTTIFVSEKLTGNKVIYIKEMYNYIDFYNLFPCVGIIFHWVLMPLLLSWFIIIFVTPKISLWFKGKHRDNKIEENKIKIEEIESETNVLKAVEEKAEKERTVEKIKEKSEEEKWDEEYKTLISKYPDIISVLNQLIYSMYGATIYGSGVNIRKFSPANEQILDSLELIEKNTDNQTDTRKQGNIYNLTTKGKYFLKISTLRE